VQPQGTTERLVDAPEQIEGLDLGLGSKTSHSLSEHQGSHEVWGTQLAQNCKYEVFDLE
jgi:hypothetical protein